MIVHNKYVWVKFFGLIVSIIQERLLEHCFRCDSHRLSDKGKGIITSDEVGG